MNTLTDAQAFQQLETIFRRIDVPQELTAWLHGHLRRTRTTQVIFDLQRASGYVWLAQDGATDCVPHPKLAGLDDAYRVFLAGPTAQHTLHMDDFQTSANSLRNRLETAAQWADGVRCSPLAECIRAISVTNNGKVSYVQPARITLGLTL